MHTVISIFSSIKKGHYHSYTRFFLHRDFLHPNFAQYSHNSTGNHKSSSQKLPVSSYFLN